MTKAQGSASPQGGHAKNDQTTQGQSPSSANGIGPGFDAGQTASWQTPRANTGPVPSFASRLTLSFVLVAVMTAALLVAVLAIVWESQFQFYTRTNMQNLVTNIANSLSIAYEENGGWTEQTLAAAAAASSQVTDVGIQVLNADSVIVYDDTWATGTDAAPLGTPSVSLAPVDPDSLVRANITDDGVKVGEVRVWAFGSDALLTKSDAAFRQNSYGAIAGAAGAAVVLACVMGVFVSKSLTRPIKKITTTARAINNGDLTARTHLTGDDELGQLGETFDDMATTLEGDLKMEHRLTSDVAHELRTPLMAMLVNVEAMQDGVLPADDEHLALVASEVRRLSRLVDAMLRLSRIENGTTQMNPRATCMAVLVGDIVEAQEQLFEDQGLDLKLLVKAPDSELYCNVDQDTMKQVVVNLLSNAMRYTPEGGHVLVTVGRDGKDVAVSVKDTGIGIAEEDLPRVFSRFWRSDASRERVSGGLGVGLALVKEIVNKHGGFVGVESELGKGTTFTVHIPATREPRHHTGHAQEPSSTIKS